MANEEQLEILAEGVKDWNEWRAEFPRIRIDLRGANLGGDDLREAKLNGADLRNANLNGAYLFKANLHKANLSNANLQDAELDRVDLTDANLQDADLMNAKLQKANLSGANLEGADMGFADLRGSKLIKANLFGTDLSSANLAKVNLSEARLGHSILDRTNLVGADLRGADLRGAVFTNTFVRNAIISGCWVYGASVWDLKGDFREQKDLRITNYDHPIITVDNVKLAQFIYLILDNREIRDVINALTSKSVLILGRFALAERKAILDAIRKKLREYNLLPIVFDFDRPIDKNITETIKTLASISYFVIADITNPRSSPLELQATVPDFQIPFVPIIQEGEEPFSMMADLQSQYRDWVLDILEYDSLESLIKTLKPAIIDRVIAKHNELQLIKAKKPIIKSVKDFL